MLFMIKYVSAFQPRYMEGSCQEPDPAMRMMTGMIMMIMKLVITGILIFYNDTEWFKHSTYIFTLIPYVYTESRSIFSAIQSKWKFEFMPEFCFAHAYN